MPYLDKEDLKAYQRIWLRKRRRAYIKAHGPCVWCGNNKFLEVDHREPAKKVDHRIWSWSEKRRKKELKKCWVLCRRCHRQKTYVERRLKDGPLTHGTNGGYHRGCKCKRCRLAHNAITTIQKREARAKRKNGSLRAH